jgi:hypothetical protein
MPSVSSLTRQYKERLLQNPLSEIEMGHVRVLFLFNVLAIAISYATAESRRECSKLQNEQETLSS